MTSDDYPQMDRRTIIKTVGASAVLSGLPTIATADESGEDTVAYNALSKTERRAFDRAAGEPGVAHFAPHSKYVKDSAFSSNAGNVFEKHKYVSWEGAKYEISMARVGIYANYQIKATPVKLDSDMSVTSLDDLPSDRLKAIQQAIDEGSYTVEPGRWESLGFSDVKNVRHNGDTYNISVIYGDSWLWELRVNPV